MEWNRNKHTLKIIINKNHEIAIAMSSSRADSELWLGLNIVKPKSKVQKSKSQSKDLGWQYNHMGHPPTHPPTYNF